MFAPKLLLFMVCAAAAAAGAGTALLFRPTAVAFPDQKFQAALAAPARTGPLENPRQKKLETRLHGLTGPNSHSARVAAALQFASLDSVEEIRDLLERDEDLPGDSSGAIAHVVLLKRWLELDPAGALFYCRQHGAAYFPKLVADYALTEPAAARALILAMPSGTARTNAWKEVCQLTLKTDPDSLWKMLDAQPMRDPQNISGNLDPLVAELVHRQPEVAMARLDSLTAIMLASTRTALAQELTQRDAAKGWAWAAAQPRPAELLRVSLRNTMKARPAEAISLLSTLPPDQQKAVIAQRSTDWKTDSTQALASAVMESAGIPADNKASLASNFLIGCALSDPAGANALVPLLTPEKLESRLTSFINSWTKSTFSGAETWVISLPPGPFRTFAENALNARRGAPAAAGSASP